MGSGKQNPRLFDDGNPLFRLNQQNFKRVLFAFTLSIALAQIGAQAQQSDNKKSGLEPVAASSPATSSKSAMGEPPGKTSSAQSLPKPDSARTGAGAKSADSKSDAAADKSTLPFPIISNDGLNSVSGVQSNSGRNFPSAIDIHGSPAGVLLHALKDTRYDLLSPLSIWLEEGPLLVSVRRPSDMVLVATKFGDVCVLAGGDALVERGENDTLRIVNLCTNSDTVFLNMHDKLWVSSPWGHAGKLQQMNRKKGKRKQNTYDGIESGAVSIGPAYELLIGTETLTMEDVKPPDSVGRRDFKAFEGGKFVVSEISIDHLTQIHELIKNLNSHGEKASSIFGEIMRNAGTLKAKQGDSGFEKNVPPPPKPVEPKRKPPTKAPPKSNVAPPPAATPNAQPKPPTAGSMGSTGNSPKSTSTANPAPASAPAKKNGTPPSPAPSNK